jgi:hypothetical protein
MPADVRQDKDKVETVTARWEKMLADRSNAESEWLTIGELCAPRKTNVLKGAPPGAKLTAGRYTGLGEESALLLANALLGNLTNPSQRWQSLQMRRSALNTVNSVQNWTDTASTEFSQALNASNFVTEASEFYLDLGTFGTAAMFKEARPAPMGIFGGWVFRTLQIGTYCIAEDKEGRVDTLFRSMAMTVRQAYQHWGENIGTEWLEFLKGTGGNKAEPDKLVAVLHAIYPRADRNPNRLDARNMPWASCYVDTERKRILGEGGFRRFPALVARWGTSAGEVRAEPRHTAIPDLQSLNRAIELEYAGWALDLAPPLFEQERAVVGSLDWTPSARNVVRKGKDSVWTLGSGSRYDISTLKKEEIRKTIEKAFFVDQIRALPPADRPSYMTAYEVAKRYEETFKLLGSGFGHLKFGFLQPLIEGGVSDLYEAEVLPPPPAEMDGEEIDIEYLGPLARAQQAADLQALDLETAWVLQAEPLVPGIKDNYRWDAIAQHRARVRGIPASLIVGQDELAAVRQAQVQANQEMAAMAKTAEMAQAVGQAAPMVKALMPKGPA